MITFFRTACKTMSCEGAVLELMKAVFAHCIGVGYGVQQPSTRNTSSHSGPAYCYSTAYIFAVVTQRVFPGIADGLLGISSQLTLFTFNACLTITITPDINWFLEMQTVRRNEWKTIYGLPEAAAFQ